MSGSLDASVRETYGVSRVTVTAAYDQLLAEGYFETRQEPGPSSPRNCPTRPFSRFASLPQARVRPRQSGCLITPPGSVSIRQMPSSSAPAESLERQSRRLAVSVCALAAAGLRATLREGTSRSSTSRVNPPGMPRLREAIAAYLARARAVRCSPIRSLSSADRSRRSTYVQGSCSIRATRSRSRSLGIRRPPVVPGARRTAARRCRSPTPERRSTADPHTRLVHVTPSHQFPIGVALPLARRLGSLEWARTHGAVVLEDDYDSEYRYSGPPLPAMQSSPTARPSSTSARSRTSCSAAFAWDTSSCPRCSIAPFMTAKWMADRHTPLVEQAALSDFITEGQLERHVRRMRRLYKHRRDVMLEALSRHFGPERRTRRRRWLHMTVRFTNGHDLRSRGRGGRRRTFPARGSTT